MHTGSTNLSMCEAKRTPANFTTMHINLCFGGTSYLPGLAKQPKFCTNKVILKLFRI